MSENKDALDEVFGEFGAPQRRRRRARVVSDVPETEAPKPRVEAPIEEPPVAAAPVVEEPIAPPEVVEPVVVEPEVIEPVVDEPEIIEPVVEEPEIVEPEPVAPVVEDAPTEPRRRRRRNAAPDDGAAKVAADATDPTETPIVEETPTERRFAFGKKPTEDAPREFGARFGASSRAAAKSGDTADTTPPPEEKPAPTGWGARFAKSGTATAAPKSGSGSRLGGLGTHRTGTGSTASTSTRPATGTARPASRPATTTRRSTGAGVGGFIQGLLGFVYTAAFVIAFLASVIGPFVSFAHISVYSGGDYIYSSEVTLLEYLISSDHSIFITFIEGFTDIGDVPDLMFYSLMIGIPSIIFVIGYIKRIIAGVKGIFTWNSKTLAGVVIGGVRATFTLLFMHSLAGYSSAAIEEFSATSYISYSFGDGLDAGFTISIAVLILTYILSFFMENRNLMYKKEEVASVARVITYLITLFLIFNYEGVDILVAMVYSFDDFNVIAIVLSITLLVMFVRLYKNAANGFAVNMACLHDTGESFGERMTADSNPKTSVMKSTFINAGVCFGAIILLEIFEVASMSRMTEVLIPTLVVAVVCAIVCKVCKVK